MSVPAPDPVLAEILAAPTPPPPQRVAPRSVPPPAAEAPREAPDVEERARTSEQPASASEPDQARTAPPDGPVPEAEPSRPHVSTIVDEAELHATEAAQDVRDTATASAPATPAAAQPSAPPPAAETPGRAAPTDREGLLARLRQRAAALTEEQVAAILRLGRS